MTSPKRSTWFTRILPMLAEFGWMLILALIQVAFPASSPERLDGWAVSSATDIAFALDLLSLLGPRAALPS